MLNSKRHKCIYSIITITVIITFLWSGFVWANPGIGVYLPDKLSVSSQATGLVPVANAFAAGQQAIRDFAKDGLLTKGEFYKKLGEELQKGTIAYLSGTPCLLYSDPKDETKLAYYVFNPNEPYFSRITTHSEVDDSLWNFLKLNEVERRAFPDVREFKEKGKTYYQQIFVMTDAEVEFINTCLKMVVPEWEVRRQKGINGRVINLVRMSAEERKGLVWTKIRTLKERSRYSRINLGEFLEFVCWLKNFTKEGTDIVDVGLIIELRDMLISSVKDLWEFDEYVYREQNRLERLFRLRWPEEDKSKEAQKIAGRCSQIFDGIVAVRAANSMDVPGEIWKRICGDMVLEIINTHIEASRENMALFSVSMDPKESSPVRFSCKPSWFKTYDIHDNDTFPIYADVKGSVPEETGLLRGTVEDHIGVSTGFVRIDPCHEVDAGLLAKQIVDVVSFLVENGANSSKELVLVEGVKSIIGKQLGVSIPDTVTLGEFITLATGGAHPVRKADKLSKTDRGVEQRQAAITKQAAVVNPSGIHEGIAKQIAALARSFPGTKLAVRESHLGDVVDLTNTVGLLRLHIGSEERVEIIAQGPEAQEAVDTIAGLLSTYKDGPEEGSYGAQRLDDEQIDLMIRFLLSENAGSDPWTASSYIKTLLTVGGERGIRGLKEVLEKGNFTVSERVFYALAGHIKETRELQEIILVYSSRVVNGNVSPSAYQIKKLYKLIKKLALENTDLGSIDVIEAILYVALKYIESIDENRIVTLGTYPGDFPEDIFNVPNLILEAVISMAKQNPQIAGNTKYREIIQKAIFQILSEYTRISREDMTLFMISIEGDNLDEIHLLPSKVLVEHDHDAGVLAQNVESAELPERLIFRGAVVSPLNSSAGFIRVDIPRKKDGSPVEKSEEVLVRELVGVIRYLTEGTNPGKELVLTEEARGILKRSGIELPEGKITAENAPGMPGVNEAVPARGRAKRGPLTIGQFIEKTICSPAECLQVIFSEFQERGYRPPREFTFKEFMAVVDFTETAVQKALDTLEELGLVQVNREEEPYKYKSEWFREEQIARIYRIPAMNKTMWSGEELAEAKIRALMIKGYIEKIEVDEFVDKIKGLLGSLVPVAELMEIAFKYLYMSDGLRDEIYYFHRSLIEDLPELLKVYPGPSERDKILKRKVADLKMELLKESKDKNTLIVKNLFSWFARIKEEVYTGEIPMDSFGEYSVEIMPGVKTEIVSFSIEPLVPGDEVLMEEWSEYARRNKLGPLVPRYNEWKSAVDGVNKGFKLISVDAGGKKRIESWTVYDEVFGEGIFELFTENAPWNGPYVKDKELKGAATALKKRLIEESVLCGYKGRLIGIPGTKEGISLGEAIGRKPTYTPRTQYGRIDWSFWSLSPVDAKGFLERYEEKGRVSGSRNLISYTDTDFKISVMERLYREVKEIAEDMFYRRLDGIGLSFERSQRFRAVLKEAFGNLEEKYKNNIAIYTYGSISRNRMVLYSDIDIVILSDREYISEEEMDLIKNEITESIKSAGYDNNKIDFRQQEYLEETIRSGNFTGGDFMDVCMDLEFVCGNEEIGKVMMEPINGLLQNSVYILDLIISGILIGVLFETRTQVRGREEVVNIKYGNGGTRDMEYMYKILQFLSLYFGEDLKFPLPISEDLTFSNERLSYPVLTKAEVKQMNEAFNFILLIRDAIHKFSGYENDELDDEILDKVAKVLSLKPDEIKRGCLEHMEIVVELLKKVKVRIVGLFRAEKGKEWFEKYENIVAELQSISKSMLEEYADSSEVTIRLLLALYCSDAGILKKIIDKEFFSGKPNWHVVTALVMRGDIDPSVLAYLYEKLKDEFKRPFWSMTRKLFARNPNAPPQVAFATKYPLAIEPSVEERQLPKVKVDITFGEETLEFKWDKIVSSIAEEKINIFIEEFEEWFKALEPEVKRTLTKNKKKVEVIFAPETGKLPDDPSKTFLADVFEGATYFTYAFFRESTRDSKLFRRGIYYFAMISSQKSEMHEDIIRHYKENEEITEATKRYINESGNFWKTRVWSEVFEPVFGVFSGVKGIVEAETVAPDRIDPLINFDAETSTVYDKDENPYQVKINYTVRDKEKNVYYDNLKIQLFNDKDELIGNLWAWIFEDSGKAGIAISLMRIDILNEDYRGKGLSSALLRVLHDVCPPDVRLKTTFIEEPNTLTVIEKEGMEEAEQNSLFARMFKSAGFRDIGIFEEEDCYGYPRGYTLTARTSGFRKVTCKVIDPLGIHAKSAVKIVKIAERYPDTEIYIEVGGRRASARKRASLLRLGVGAKGMVDIIVRGKDAEKLLGELRALSDLFQFGEEVDTVTEEGAVNGGGDVLDDRTLIGGKAANLRKLKSLSGMKIPEWFEITTETYNEFIGGNSIDLLITELMEKIERNEDVGEQLAKIREAIANAEVPQNIKDEIVRDCLRVFGNIDKEEISLIVRSSEVSEDTEDTSSAGQYETLSIDNTDELFRAIKRCWASLYTEGAFMYRRRFGIDEKGLNMGLIVQRKIEPRYYGVVTNLMIEGEEYYLFEFVDTQRYDTDVVSGKVTPRYFLLTADGKIKPEFLHSDWRCVLKSFYEDIYCEYISQLKTGLGLEKFQMEFVIDKHNNKYVLQVRPAKRASFSSITNFDRPLTNIEDLKILPASPGQAQGKAVYVTNEKDLPQKDEPPYILLTEFADNNTCQLLLSGLDRGNLVGVITTVGGYNTHFATVAREADVPYMIMLYRDSDERDMRVKKVLGSHHVYMNADRGVIKYIDREKQPSTVFNEAKAFLLKNRFREEELEGVSSIEGLIDRVIGLCQKCERQTGVYSDWRGSSTINVLNYLSWFVTEEQKIREILVLILKPLKITNKGYFLGKEIFYLVYRILDENQDRFPGLLDSFLMQEISDVYAKMCKSEWYMGKGVGIAGGFTSDVDKAFPYAVRSSASYIWRRVVSWNKRNPGVVDMEKFKEVKRNEFFKILNDTIDVSEDSTVLFNVIMDGDDIVGYDVIPSKFKVYLIHDQGTQVESADADSSKIKALTGVRGAISKEPRGFIRLAFEEEKDENSLFADVSNIIGLLISGVERDIEVVLTEKVKGVLGKYGVSLSKKVKFGELYDEVQRIKVSTVSDKPGPIGKKAEGIYEELWEVDLVDGRLGEGVAIGIGERSSKYEKINPGLLQEKLNELVSVFGPGILAVVDAIRIVDNIGVSSLPERQAFWTGKSQVSSDIVPYAMMVKEDGRNVLLLDVDAFDSEEILYIVLEHELKESIMTVIPCENDAVRELTTNFMSLKLALENGIRFDREQLKELGADLQFYEALEVLQAMAAAGQELNDRDIIAVAIEHMRGMPYYRDLFHQFGFAGFWEAKVMTAQDRYRAAIDVFNDIMEAKVGVNKAEREKLQKELKETVEEVEINVSVVKTFTGKQRVIGLEGLPKVLQSMIGVVAKQIYSVDRFEQQITKASSVKYILVSEKRLKELKDAIGEEEYERIRKELEDNNYEIRTRKPRGVERKDVIRLVDPVDLRGMRKLQDVLYLPMPYTRSSLYMAANIVQAGDEVSSGNLDNVDSLIKGFIRDLYSQIIGGEVSDSDLVKLFNTPWDFLPKIRRVIDDLNSLREAILQIEKAA